MAQDFFSVVGGIEIQSDDLSSNVNILQGDGAPGSRVVEQDAPIGSTYYQTDAAPNDHNVFWKFRDLNNDQTDWRIAASTEFVDNNPQQQVDTGSALALTTTVLDNTLLVSEATEVKWMLQVKDSTGKRRAFEFHALTDGITSKFTRYANLRIGSPIGNIGFDVDIGGSPLSWNVTLNPSAVAGDLTYTLKRLGFSHLA